MGWIIGIICVILVIAYWRFFLPLALVLAVIIGLFIWNEQVKHEKTQKEEAATELALRNKISAAQQNQTDEGKEWYVIYRKDPASEQQIARRATIRSNDNLCSMSVEKRMNGSDLTDFSIVSQSLAEIE